MSSTARRIGGSLLLAMGLTAVVANVSQSQAVPADYSGPATITEARAAATALRGSCTGPFWESPFEFGVEFAGRLVYFPEFPPPGRIRTNIEVAAGSYQLRYVSYDGYTTRPTVPEQLNEQWFVDTANSALSEPEPTLAPANRGVTADLQDFIEGAMNVGTTGSFSLAAGDAWIFHSPAFGGPYDGTPNSVWPIAFCLEPQGSPTTTTAPTTLPPVTTTTIPAVTTTLPTATTVPAVTTTLPTATTAPAVTTTLPTATTAPVVTTTLPTTTVATTTVATTTEATTTTIPAATTTTAPAPAVLPPPTQAPAVPAPAAPAVGTTPAASPTTLSTAPTTTRTTTTIPTAVAGITVSQEVPAPAQAGEGELAVTGSRSLPVLYLGLVMILGGLALVVVPSRRQRQ